MPLQDKMLREINEQIRREVERRELKEAEDRRRAREEIAAAEQEVDFRSVPVQMPRGSGVVLGRGAIKAASSGMKKLQTTSGTRKKKEHGGVSTVSASAVSLEECADADDEEGEEEDEEEDRGYSSTAIDSSTPRAISVALPDIADDPTLAALEASCPRYVELVRQALTIDAGEGFADVERMDVFREAKDKRNRPIFIFLPAHIPARADIDRLVLYVYARMHKTVIREGREFTAFWLCNNGIEPSRLSLKWFRRTYKSTPYQYQDRCMTLVMVHPPMYVRFNIFMLSFAHTFGCSKYSLWKKVDFVQRIEFLDHYVPVEVIKSLPEEVKRFDIELEEEMMEQHLESKRHGYAGYHHYAGHDRYGEFDDGGWHHGGGFDSGMGHGIHHHGFGGGPRRLRRDGRPMHPGPKSRAGMSKAGAHQRSYGSNYEEDDDLYTHSAYATKFDLPKRNWED